MDWFSPLQTKALERVIDAFRDLPGLAALVLGGSQARGRARPDSDIDIGLYYRDSARFEIEAVRARAARLNDAPRCVVTDFGEWGPWVDGGAWLVVERQKVDLLYRSLDKVEATLAEAQAGRFEIHFEQQPPFGFFGPTLLGEIAIARPLIDRDDVIAALKARVSPMPQALAQAVVQSRLWSVEFGLTAFAPKYAAAGNVFALAGCLTRFGQALVLALFALNGRYLLSEKTALVEIDEFDKAPRQFGARLNALLATIGDAPAPLSGAVNAVSDLFEETRSLAGSWYRPAWPLSAGA
jgi:hypothetical protein